MISPAASIHAVPILKFPSVAERAGDSPFSGAERITLRLYYERVLLPYLSDPSIGIAIGSSQEDFIALGHWERETRNPDLRDIDPHDLVTLRDRLIAKQRSPATINKTWRELAGILREAVEDGYLHRVPVLDRKDRSRRKGQRVGSSRLVAEQPKRQRETISDEEMAILFQNAKNATYPVYPRQTEYPAPLLWRVWMILQWTYGPRTIDLQRLRKSDIHWKEGLIVFEAMKTRKLQGLPITPLVQRALKRIWGHAERVFPGFVSPGGQLHGKWRQGYYTVWRRDLGAEALGIKMKHLRERMVTCYNGIEPGLGSWIAGHFVPGVTAAHYDKPDQRIRRAICEAPIPRCFAEWRE